MGTVNVQMPKLVVNAQGQVVTEFYTVQMTDPVPEATIRDRATQAVAVNNAFLAIGAPTNVQTLAQVQRLTRECTGIIRLLSGQVDDTTGT